MNTVSASQPRWKCFFSLVAVIITGNMIAHLALEFPKEEVRLVTVGSLVDFVVIIPLLAYFLIFRKRRKVAPILGVAFFGYLTGMAIIPDENLSEFRWIGLVLVAGEVALLAAEVWVVVKLVKVSKQIRRKIESKRKGIAFVLVVW